VEVQLSNAETILRITHGLWLQLLLSNDFYLVYFPVSFTLAPSQPLSPATLSRYHRSRTDSLPNSSISIALWFPGRVLEIGQHSSHMKAIKHHLLQDVAAPSIEVLNDWLDEHGVTRCDGVDVGAMADGSGWRVVASRDLDVGETSEWMSRGERGGGERLRP
jgi:hypothetical protein